MSAFDSLYEVAKQGTVDELAHLLKAGGDPNQRALSGATPLHAASRRLQGTPFVDLLLLHGADPNICTSTRSTCLHYAVLSNQLGSARSLLQYGAEVNRSNTEGTTALCLALFNQSWEAASLLLLHGADFSKNDQRVLLSKDQKSLIGSGIDDYTILLSLFQNPILKKLAKPRKASYTAFVDRWQLERKFYLELFSGKQDVIAAEKLIEADTLDAEGALSLLKRLGSLSIRARTHRDLPTKLDQSEVFLHSVLSGTMENVVENLLQLEQRKERLLECSAHLTASHQTLLQQLELFSEISVPQLVPPDSEVPNKSLQSIRAEISALLAEKTRKIEMNLLLISQEVSSLKKVRSILQRQSTFSSTALQISYSFFSKTSEEIEAFLPRLQGAARTLTFRLFLMSDSSLELSKVVEDVENTLLCPITQERLRDPVTAADGHTYERAAISSWLEKSSRSPITNLPLAHLNLETNYLILRLLEKSLKKSEPGVLREP